MPDPVLLAIDGAIATVTLNRPEAHNALDLDAMLALRRHLMACRDDPAVRVVVLTGAGGRAFCVGSDLKRLPPVEASYAQMHDLEDEASARRGNYLRLMMLHRLKLWKPIVAAIDGYCYGGGFELALQADLRLASTKASFALTEAKVGSFPGAGGVPLLLRALPRAVAMKLLLTGDAIDAAEAHRLGLVSDVVAGEELLAHAMATAGRIAQCAPLAVQAIKRTALESEGLSHADAVDLSEKYFGILLHTHDRAEGRRAFAEKRPPRFEGR